MQHPAIDRDRRPRAGNPAGSTDGSAAMQCRRSAATRARCRCTPTRAFSINNCRASRPVPAPSAARMVSSRCRAVARASCMLATLAMAVANSRTDAISRITMAGRTSAAAASLASRTMIWMGSRAPNSDIATRPASGAAIARAVPSAAAWVGVTPGLSRANRAHDRAGLGPAGVVDRRRLPRHPHARFRARKSELPRHDADNRVLHAVKHQRLPNDVVATTEAVVPTMRMRPGRPTAGRYGLAAFGRLEDSPANRTHAQQLNRRGRHARVGDPRRLAGAGQRRLAVAAVITDGVERLWRVSPGDVAAVHHRARDASLATAARLAETYQPLGIAPRQRAQQHAVRDAEERRHRANTERDGEDRDGRVARAARAASANRRSRRCRAPASMPECDATGGTTAAARLTMRLQGGRIGAPALDQ